MKDITYLISEDNGSHNHAGSKARNDVESFLYDPNIKILKVKKFLNSNGVINKVNIMNSMMRDWIKIIKETKKNSNIIVQYPLESPKDVVNFWIKTTKKIKKVNFIAIVHDLESLRFDTKRKFEEIKYLNEFKYIIVHNDRMKQYLCELGIQVNKLIVLEIFDYKVEDFEISERTLKNEVAIAGNLSSNKSGYIYKLDKINTETKFNLFGPNYDGHNYNNIKYFGQFPPEKIPKALKGSFGLVWDGSEVESCTGTTGKYLKYNNPHKLSLYIISRIPIIIWKEAAMADFVQREGIGIVINNLEEIQDKINTIDKISEKLREGYYIKKAVKESLK